MGASTKTMEIEEAMERMPIFPLPQIVLFPQALLPLHIFEPRYRALLKDCLASHRTMALALLGPDIPTETSDAEPPGRPHVGVVTEWSRAGRSCPGR